MSNRYSQSASLAAHNFMFSNTLCGIFTFQYVLKLLSESGKSSWELLQNCYPIKAYTEQKISVALALTDLFLEKLGKGICRIHGGGFAGVIMCVVPEEETENYVSYISEFAGKENVYPMNIRAVGAVHIEK